jgi:transcriptional regulator with PAS, ATPase and Fis domain
MTCGNSTSRRPEERTQDTVSREQEENYIKWVLGEIGGNKKLAARILGINLVCSGGSPRSTD